MLNIQIQTQKKRHIKLIAIIMPSHLPIANVYHCKAEWSVKNRLGCCAHDLKFAG